MKRLLALVAVLTIALIAGCSHDQPASTSAQNTPATADFTILSGSENKALEPIINQYAQDHHVNIKMDYQGSVDMMLHLQDNSITADAVWPANSLWVALGDTKKLVKHSESIMRTPVVLGVKKSVATRLGWINKPVKVDDILNAAEHGKLRYMMTSATQSNSGASAYFGYLYAFAGSPEALTSKNLQDPKVRDKIKRILGTINRSAGSSGWLKDLFMTKYADYDGMVNYEAVIIEANKELVAKGQEPLYVIYPVDGTAIADSPLGYVDRGNAAQEKQFLDLQKYLLSPSVQQQILAQGRRVGLVGIGTENPDKTTFNPDWGIDTKRVITPIRFPDTAVIQQALDLYQTAFRKPSLTIYCLDFSGSMQGEGERGLKSAMRTLLDQQQARTLFLQASPQDITMVIPFNDQVIAQWSVKGNDPTALAKLDSQIEALQAGGGTDIYQPVMDGFDLLQNQHVNLDNYFPAVILMTDGRSERDRFDELSQHVNSLNIKDDIPVFSILFGDADKSQLTEIADHTSGKIFDGTKDLAKAFREVKGYN